MGSSTETPVSFGIAYVPPITVSWNGARVNIGAVGHRRSDSSRIWRTEVSACTCSYVGSAVSPSTSSICARAWSMYCGLFIR